MSPFEKNLFIASRLTMHTPDGILKKSGQVQTLDEKFARSGIFSPRHSREEIFLFSTQKVRALK